MAGRKRETFIFEGLGFPVVLINAPWRKVFGEWALDINLKKLQHSVLQTLIHKRIPLTGAELRFIRKFFEMSTSEFGKLFFVTHAAVVKWENNQTQINPNTELCIRLYVMDHLHPKDKEFRKFYHQISSELAKHKKSSENDPIQINVDEALFAC